MKTRRSLKNKFGNAVYYIRLIYTCVYCKVIENHCAFYLDFSEFFLYMKYLLQENVLLCLLLKRYYHFYHFNSKSYFLDAITAFFFQICDRLSGVCFPSVTYP